MTQVFEVEAFHPENGWQGRKLEETKLYGFLNDRHKNKKNILLTHLQAMRKPLHETEEE